MPILVNAVTNGEAAKLSSFHGRIVASRKMEPTKKIAILTITELAALVTARSGSDDSAAAIVAISAPTIEKMTDTMIAATLMPANQNSNSPKDDTENRFVAVIKTMRTNAVNHSGMSIQYWMILAPAIASNPTTITQKYQYNHPTEKPAQLPSALRE